jgi:hypothetical protein
VSRLLARLVARMREELMASPTGITAA